MTKFNKILADHDDVLVHGIILYSQADDDHVYADKACTIVVEGDELKDIYLKGCVVATVSDGEVTGYNKPTSLETASEGGFNLVSGGGSGGVSSWNDLSDKPFMEYTETYHAVKWDGDLTNKVTVDYYSAPYVHISDIVPTMDDINKGHAVLYDDGTHYSPGFYEEENGYLYSDGETVAIVPTDNFDPFGYGDLIFPKKGIYVRYEPGYGSYCNGFELKDFELFDPYTRPAVARLNEIFLPLSVPVIATVEDAATPTGSALTSHTYEQLNEMVLSGYKVYVQNYGSLYDLYYNMYGDDGSLVFESISGLIPFAKRLMYIYPDNSVKIENSGYLSEITLQSPNGTAYRITVNDDGTIETAKK